MIRQGQTLTFLAAPFDSSSFRVLHSTEFTDEPLHSNELRLRLSAYCEAGTEAGVKVIWKDLHVRATRVINRKTNAIPVVPRKAPAAAEPVTPAAPIGPP